MHKSCLGWYTTLDGTVRPKGCDWAHCGIVRPVRRSQSPTASRGVMNVAGWSAPRSDRFISPSITNSLPLPQLLPYLHQRLDLPRTRQPRIDQPAILMRPIVHSAGFPRKRIPLKGLIAQLIGECDRTD